MKIWKNAVLFYLGGSSYMTLEFLWRRHSHGSMFLAGGLCFLLIGALGKARPRLPLPLRMIAGAAVITMVELGFGLAVNQEFEVWDYRGQTGNFLGQICPVFSLLWIPVSLAAMVLYEIVDKKLDRLSLTA